MKNSERTKQTKERIQNAYLNLRKHKNLNQIRITELCREAETNRTTFYHYYQDIYDLNNAVEDRILGELLEDFPYKGLIYEDSERYVVEFSRCLEPRKKDLEILGHGREAEQSAKLEQWLITLGKKEAENMEEEVLLSFVVGGCVYAISRNRTSRKYPEEAFNSFLTQLVHLTMNQDY